MKHTTLEEKEAKEKEAKEKEAKSLQGTELSLYFHKTFLSLSTDMRQCVKNTLQCGGFPNATQGSVTNIHPNVWKVIPLSRKEETSVKKRKSSMPDKEMNQQAKKKKSIKYYE